MPVSTHSNVDAAMLPSMRDICVRAGGQHEAQQQSDGRFTVTCTLPEAPSEEVEEKRDEIKPARPARPRRPSVRGSTLRIEVTETDLDALQRVATAEAGHFGAHGQDQLRGGLCAVVDTILNRVAHPEHPDSIVAVVNQRSAFSPVAKAGGTWTKLPPAPPAIAKIIAEHVRARAAGKPSEIGGATHFLNPHFSSPSSLADWGNFVVRNAVKVFGNPATRDVHFHGTAPGEMQAPPYVVVLAGAGLARDTPPPAGQIANEVLRRRVLAVCLAELERFGSGRFKETDDPQFRRVGDYWKAVGHDDRDGRFEDENGDRPPWSAAFISFVMKEAGSGDRFPFSEGHWKFFQHFVQHPGLGLYEARLVSDATPRPGDILHFGRLGAERFDFEAARRGLRPDGSYPSHSDIVVAVDLAAKKVTTVGGNVTHSVKQKTFALDSNGRLRVRREGNRTLPWIGMLQMV